jgi:hypothetical protein
MSKNLLQKSPVGSKKSGEIGCKSTTIFCNGKAFGDKSKQKDDRLFRTRVATPIKNMGGPPQSALRPRDSNYPFVYLLKR